MPELLPTRDGSYTLQSDLFGATYHSLHGACTESRHVFTEAGLRHHYESCSDNIEGAYTIQLLEIGAGSLLNAAVALDFAREYGGELSPSDAGLDSQSQSHTLPHSLSRPRIRNESQSLSPPHTCPRSLQLHYTGVELYPLEWDVIRKLHAACAVELRPESWAEVIRLYPELMKGASQAVGPHSLQLWIGDALQWNGLHKPANVVFFDAFAPESQPQMWEEAFLQKVVGWMQPGACLVTYCVKGEVRRRFQSLGCTTEKLPGPPGKREILRVQKPKNPSCT